MNEMAEREQKMARYRDLGSGWYEGHDEAGAAYTIVKNFTHDENTYVRADLGDLGLYEMYIPDIVFDDILDDISYGGRGTYDYDGVKLRAIKKRGMLPGVEPYVLFDDGSESVCIPNSFFDFVATSSGYKIGYQVYD